MHRKYYFRFFLGIIVSILSISCGKLSDIPEMKQVSGFVSTLELSNQNVKFFLEDNDGLMWIATERGLNVISLGGGYVTFESTGDLTGLAPSTIWSIFEDTSNRLWVCSGDGVYQLEESFFWKKIPIKPSPLVFRSFYENSQKDVFAGNNRALYKFNPKNNCFEVEIQFKEFDSDKYHQLYFDENDDIWRVYSNKIELISKDGYNTVYSASTGSDIVGSVLIDNYIWIAHRSSIQVFDIRRRAFYALPEAIVSSPYLKGIEIKSIHPTKSGFAIVSSADAIYFYNTAKDEIVRNINYGDHEITAVYESSDGNYWIGYNNNGYDVIDNSLNLSPGEEALRRHLEGKPVKNVSLDSEGNLYVLYGKSNLVILDWKSDEFNEVNLASMINPSYPRRVGVTYMMCDSKEKDIIWILSENSLFKLKRTDNGGVVIQNRYQAGSEPFGGIYQDSKHRIILYGKGHYIYVLEDGSSELRPVFCSELAQVNIRDVVELSPDEIIICSVFDDMRVVNLRTGVSSVLYRGPSYFYPTNLYKTRSGEVFITTNGSGVFHFRQGDSALRSVDSDLTTFSESIIESDGSLYIGTESGLCLYDLLGDKVSEIDLEGYDDLNYSSDATCLMPDGKIVFGSNKGILILNPSSVNVEYQTPFFISYLMTFEGSYVTQSPANKVEFVSLSRKEQQVGISVSAQDITGPNNSILMCRIDNEPWTPIVKGQDVLYSQLSFGKHLFKVSYVDDNGNENESSSRSLIIKIKSPFMLSSFMMMVYILLIAVVFLIVLRVIYNINKAREEARRSQYEKDMQLALNEKNMDFFTNMSHEFRTPLTMIVGATEMISREKGYSPQENKYTRLLFRNTQRMQRIVDQLLDMSKVENNSLALNVRMLNASSVIGDIVDSFKLTSESKGVKLSFDTIDDSLLSFVDSDILEKAIYNILSNAIKFTPSGGAIAVKLDIARYDKVVEDFTVATEDNYLRIRVMDTGIGIPEDKRDVIFNKFYQVEQNKSIGGTGVGLYFTKQIIRLHHGDIVVQSPDDPEFTGSQFSIVLPMSAKAYTKEEMTSENEQKFEKDKEKFLSEMDSHVDVPEETSNGDRKVVLAIDDDPEVLFYLKSILGSEFKVVVKFDATSGFGCLGEIHPDIVISDVLMLDMNGYELCEQIKDSSEFSNIPVILLTAKSSNEDRIRGLEARADAYVTKPFEPSYLIAQINNLIQKREAAKEIVSGVTLATKNKLEEILHQRDREFMDTLYQIMEENLINEDLDVTSVYEKMGVGRSSFYNKVKELTGVSPASLFRSYKLNRAKEILESGKYKISAVAEMTGFCSASYFSTLFKKEFGVTPKEFIADKL